MQRLQNTIFYVLNTVALLVFASETVKLCNNFRLQMAILTEFRFCIFLLNKKILDRKMYTVIFVTP